MEQIDVVERLKTFMEFDCSTPASFAKMAGGVAKVEALGHKHGSNVTGIYIKYSLNKIDAANRQVIDYLQEK